MKQLKHTLVFIALISFASCDNEDTNVDTSFISGFYQIASITSNEAVDLNGDTETSTDLKTEIDDYFKDNDYAYDLEIRPNTTNDTEFKLISIYFPEPNLSFDFPSRPQGYVEFAKNSVGYQYEFENDKFTLMPSDNDFIQVLSLELANDNKIQSTVSKSYYDFEIEDWKTLEIVIVYRKLD
ncbi:hypothetical protein [Roseivirga sp.]|uniref:hypothetical protein n=1 Tax=Roseivirga sp. TaxID=1964215 RepID=UPI003B8B8089